MKVVPLQNVVEKSDNATEHSKRVCKNKFQQALKYETKNKSRRMRRANFLSNDDTVEESGDEQPILKVDQDGKILI